MKDGWKHTGDHNRARLGEYMKVVNLEAADLAGGAIVVSVSCTPCMLFSVLTHDHGIEK
jgi:hypothetical protein